MFSLVGQQNVCSLSLLHPRKFLLEDKVDTVSKTLLAFSDLLELSQVLFDVFYSTRAVVFCALNSLAGIVLCANVHHHRVTVLQSPRNVQLNKNWKKKLETAVMK